MTTSQMLYMAEMFAEEKNMSEKFLKLYFDNRLNHGIHTSVVNTMKELNLYNEFTTLVD